MTRKQAYCCLNCTNLPPCNAAAGNCKECCKDCTDTSICKFSAFFDGSSFYSNITFTGSLIYETPSDFRPGFSFSGFSDWRTERKNASLELFSFQSSASFNHRLGNEDDQTIIAIGSVSISRSSPSDSVKKNGSVYVYDGPMCGSQNPFCAGEIVDCKYADGYLVPACQIVVANPVGECDQAYPSQVSFSRELKLYNNKGEQVGLEAFEYPPSYDPCYAIATWNPPPCHFFAP
jgi:hypothetical protein